MCAKWHVFHKYLLNLNNPWMSLTLTGSKSSHCCLVIHTHTHTLVYKQQFTKFHAKIMHGSATDTCDIRIVDQGFVYCNINITTTSYNTRPAVHVHIVLTFAVAVAIISGLPLTSTVLYTCSYTCICIGNAHTQYIHSHTSKMRSCHFTWYCTCVCSALYTVPPTKQEWVTTDTYRKVAYNWEKN